MSDKQFNEMVNFQSGLLGVSETSSDMRYLLDHETENDGGGSGCCCFATRSKMDRRIRGGVGRTDTLVFAAASARRPPWYGPRAAMAWDSLDRTGRKRNAANEGWISIDHSRVDGPCHSHG